MEERGLARAPAIRPASLSRHQQKKLKEVKIVKERERESQGAETVEIHRSKDGNRLKGQEGERYFMQAGS